MRQVEEYLDKALAAARLAPADEARVRAELKEHLMTLLEAAVARAETREEAWTMVEKEFGDPQALGKEIARAKGRFLTMLKRRTRKFAVALVIFATVVFSVRAFAVRGYHITGACVAPYAPQGACVLVNCLAGAYHPDDLIVFRGEKGLSCVGIVKSVGANGDVVVAKNGQTDRTVPRKAVIGRVFLQTR